MVLSDLPARGLSGPGRGIFTFSTSVFQPAIITFAGPFRKGPALLADITDRARAITCGLFAHLLEFVSVALRQGHGQIDGLRERRSCPCLSHHRTII